MNIGLGEALTDANALDKCHRRSHGHHRPEARHHARQAAPSPTSACARATRSASPPRSAETACTSSSTAWSAAALPRIRDFQGLNPNAFDGRGNYSLGIREQLIFPEIDYDKVDKVRGLQVTIVTTATTDEEGRTLLELMGMPFRKN